MSRGRIGAVGRRIQTLFDVGTLGGTSDGCLLERFTTGDRESAEAAFTALVERHGPMVWRVCRSVLTDPNDVDDAFQATFLVLVRRARALWVRDSLGPWLFQAARRTALRARSLAARRRVQERAAASRRPEWIEPSAFDDLDAAIHEEIDRLPARHREVVVLCVLQGLTDSQAALRLGWPLGTVHSRLARGRDRLRRRLASRGLAPAAILLASRIPGEAVASTVPLRLIQATVLTALRLTTTGWREAALPTTVATLIEGVLRMFWLPKLQAGVTACALLGATVFATAVVSSDGDELDSTQAIDASNAVAPPNNEPVSAVSQSPASSIVGLSIERSPKQNVQALGTILWSDAEQAIVVTTSKSFDTRELMKSEIPPFTGKVTVFLAEPESSPFQTQGYFSGSAPALETHPGELVDAGEGVALVRIRPGRRLPRSRIVPRDWKPTAGTDVVLVERFLAGVPITRPTTLLSAEDAYTQGTGMRLGDRFLATRDRISQQVNGGGLFTQADYPFTGRPGALVGLAHHSLYDRDLCYFTTASWIHDLLDKNGLSDLVRESADEDERLIDALVPAFQASQQEPERPVLLELRVNAVESHRMRPIVKVLVDQGYPVKSIDADFSTEETQRYKVSAFPTYLVLDASGNEIDRISGVQSAARLARFYEDARARAGSTPVWRGTPQEKPTPLRVGVDDSDRLDRVEKRVEEMMRKLDLLLDRTEKKAEAN